MMTVNHNLIMARNHRPWDDLIRWTPDEKTSTSVPKGKRRKFKNTRDRLKSKANAAKSKAIARGFYFARLMHAKGDRYDRLTRAYEAHKKWHSKFYK